MNRRGFLSLLGLGAAGMVMDPERLLWVPGAKTIFLPPVLDWKSIPSHFGYSEGALVASIWEEYVNSVPINNLFSLSYATKLFNTREVVNGVSAGVRGSLQPGDQGERRGDQVSETYGRGEAVPVGHGHQDHSVVQTYRARIGGNRVGKMRHLWD